MAQKLLQKTGNPFNKDLDGLKVKAKGNWVLRVSPVRLQLKIMKKS